MVLGISGYIASGKSEAGRYLKKRGAYFIDADDVVNKLYKEGGAGYKKIFNFFGSSFFRKNGMIDRKKLAEFVFSDVNKMKILNGLIHPLVAREIASRIKNSGVDFIALEAVYLDGDDMEGVVDKKIWIDCPDEVIMRRAAKKDEYSEKMVRKILGIQKEIGIKPKNPDYCVDNAKGKKSLTIQLEKIIKDLKVC